MRPANQRYPQPNFVFPVTPPGTAGLDVLGHERSGLEGDSDLHQSQWTPTPRPSPPEKNINRKLQPFDPLATRHRRALSDSTLQDATPGNDSDAGAFKIVISKPGDEQRPKTTEDLNPKVLPHLDISIPSWRIGVPRFTGTGTPLIRGSSYAPSFAQSDEMQSARGSIFDRSQRDLKTPLPSLGPRKPSTLRIPQARFSRSTQRHSPGLIPPKSPMTAHPLRATFMSTRIVIDAPMYDDLTFRPACDDRSIVRYAPTTGAVTAASPPRLVAEITSPSFLDYELISDFFLTFRAFLEPSSLLRMLVARLRWAALRSDETGMIVHVRAFVALRHWILNYFMDDFVVDYGLRKDFCELLNHLVEDLSSDSQDFKVQLKILNELKKCWRRVCAQYWDGPEFDDGAKPEMPIRPGGIAGHRDPRLDPSFWSKEESEAPQLSSLFPVPEAAATSFYADVSRAGHIEDSIVIERRPTTPENYHSQANDKDFGPWSPTSLASLDIVSCSFPGKNLRNVQPNIGHPLAAHPVSSSSVYNQTGPVATTPKALVGKRVRPNQHHQRNSSLPESPTEKEDEKMSYREHDFAMAAPHAGSLVRGDVMPPGKAFVDIAPSSKARQTTIFEDEEGFAPRLQGSADAMSGRGMRRLIGSVRRALSTRGQGMLSTQGQLISGVAAGAAASATSNRLPGTAVVPQQPSSRDGARPPVRIDLLGAEVAEDFKRAVREDAADDAKRYGLPMEPPREEPDLEYSAARMESTTFNSLPQNQRRRHFSDTGLTGGSQSIVIVDDTVPSGTEVNGGLPMNPSANPSVEAFGDTLMPNGGHMTPPTTPPQHDPGMARRSSHVVNDNIRTAMSPEPLPPFVPDMDTLGAQSATPSESGHRRTFSLQSRRRPPLSGRFSRMHRRNRSTRTHQSLNSIMRQRNASFSSDMIPPSTLRSFDATTYTRYSAGDEGVETPVPKPLRVLRRRPGGDLRAATNVDELDPKTLRRSQSLGSLSAFSESIRGSRAFGYRPGSIERPYSSVSDDYEARPEAFSVGQLADKPTKREVSLCSSRSSKPVMRPSFEAEAKKLAQIPDDEDDGGVESALAKLEGKAPKLVPKLSMDLQNRDEILSETTSVDYSVRSSQQTKKGHRHFTFSEEGKRESEVAPSPNSQLLSVPRASTTGHRSFLSDASRESYSSTPLLDAGLTDDGQSRCETKNWTDHSILQDEDDNPSPAPAAESKDDHRLSFNFIHTMDDVLPGLAPPHSIEEQSFLDSDQSDLSSEMSAEETPTKANVKALAPLTKRGLPKHPLGDGLGAPEAALPSPPNSHDPESDSPRDAHHSHEFSKEGLATKPLPPTPDATPGAAFGPHSPFDLIGSARPPFEPEGQHTDESRKYSVHLPFILAFDSETLAQQFTLIEKDALNEVDWKELVDMDWKNATNHNSRSWVDFLRNTDAHGVEVVIARFNLVVKWTISEIVLTQHIEERARCLIKYIHIAAHCRQYRNFATMAQLAIALSSNEVSRLARTWELVPSKDMKTLRELENLVTPMRNFFNIRAEMESGPDIGCIPFVGIYTHDLLYNAQRPSEIASSPTTPPLVNFERCRIGASVVKTLLRLLEASTRYDFRPIEGITERCLWIGALTDEEIRRHSGNLE